MDNINIKHFKYFSVAKSTSIVVAILPLFLNDYKDISVQNIVLISGYFFLIPLLLEFPFGLLADKFGAKYIINFGLSCFILAFLALLILKGNFAYIIYMFGITFAAISFSGSTESILVSIVNDKSQLFNIQSQIDSYIYKATIPLIMLGGLLYYISPLMPFIVQIILLFISIINLNKIVSTRKENNATSTSLLAIIKATKDSIKDSYIITFMLLIALSSFLVVLSNRVFQIQFAQSFNILPAVAVSFLFILGNFVSSYSVLIFRKLFNLFIKPFAPIMILGISLSLSYALMSFNHYILLTLGYSLLCCFKSAYRAYLPSKMIAIFPNAKATASIISISAVFTALLGMIFSILYSSVFVSFSNVNLILSLVSLILFLIANIVLLILPTKTYQLLPNNAMSQKKHFLRHKYYTFSYLQVYKDPSNINANIKEGCISKSLYPSPSYNILDKTTISWEYIDGELLSMLPNNLQQKFLEKLIDIFQTHLANNIRISHGDLHPDNILIKNNNIFVIDWDLCSSEHDKYFDIFTLLTSPRISVTLEQRIKSIITLTTYTEAKAIEEMKIFINFKINSLSHLNGDFISKILFNYKTLLLQINDYKSNNY